MTTKTQFLKKIDGAQSSIERKLIPLRIMVVKPNTSLKGPKNIMTILDP
jgi:hypothetical protein